MHATLQYLLTYISANWESIGTYLLSGAAVSAVAEAWIRFRKHDKALWKELTVGTLSVVATASNWIVNNYATSPLASLGNVGPRIFIAAVFAHRLLVNPLWKAIEKNLVGTWNDARAYRAEQTTNAVVAENPTNSFL